MLLREVQRAALMEDLLWKLVGNKSVEGVSTPTISITVKVALVKEAQELLNDPRCVGRYADKKGKTAT